MRFTAKDVERALGKVDAIAEAHGAKVKADVSAGNEVCRALIEQVYVITNVRGVAEYCFHPTRKWRWDCCWPDYMIAFELNGYTSHSKRGRMEEDNTKLSAGVRLGWKVLYGTAAQARRQSYLWIVELIEAQLGASP